MAQIIINDRAFYDLRASSTSLRRRWILGTVEDTNDIGARR